MSARILILPTRLSTAVHVGCRPAVPRAEGASLDPHETARRLQFWRGASGRAYPHTVYGLIECPPLPMANFVLVRRDDRGRASALAIGRVGEPAQTLNLARIRQLGATLGATEVHVHLLARTAQHARDVETDIRAVVACEPAPGAPSRATSTSTVRLSGSRASR